MIYLYKYPQTHNLYWAIKETRGYDSKLTGWILYFFVMCDANTIAEDVDLRAVVFKGSAVFWVGDVLVNAPLN